MTYPQLVGKSTVNNVTFSSFGQYCLRQTDAIFTPQIGNDDAQFPVTLSNIRLHNVLNDSKVWIMRPELSKIEPSDCVDMDCDGKKKNLFIDSDGSFLGAPGSVISQSEFEWNVNGPRALGDFRIPKPMLTFPNGTAMTPRQLYSRPGIVRDEQMCQYEASWQAYRCFGLRHKMLIIESMDHDTEVRRLSPVAILSDNKYLDLINGPQDHGWCTGYTCMKRVSTFIALVAADQSYDIVFTSTPPEGLRFRLVDADSSFKVRLSMFYQVSQRIDLYKDMTYVAPSNGRYVSGK